MKYVVPAIASLLLAAQLLSAIPKLSPTTDEFTFHVPSGLVYWKTGNFSALNPAAPPLARLLTTAPAILDGVHVPIEHPSLSAFDGKTFSRHLYYESGNDHYRLTLLTRLPIALLSLLLLWLVWGWSSHLYGALGGAMSAFVYLFCPNILAHSTLATQDLALTAAWVAAIWALWFYGSKINLQRLLLASFLLGIALLMKHTAVLLFPLSLLLIGLAQQQRKTSLRSTLLSTLQHWTLYVGFAFLVVWSGYGFEIKPLLADLPRIEEKISFLISVMNSLHFGPPLQQRILHFAESVPLPLPSYFISLLGVIRHSAEGHLSFLMGEFSQTGWPHYFLVAFLIKTPIPILILLIATGAVTCWKKGWRNRADLFLLLPAALLFFSASRSHLQIGLRHILPLYPLLYIWLGKLGTFWRLRPLRPALALSGTALSLFLVIPTQVIAPHYLAYFNEGIGGPKKGHHYLLDSNIEWGQGLVELGHFVKKNHIQEIYLDYPWPPLPEKYGIPARTPLTSSSPQPGWYAISVNHLHQYPWAKGLQPTAHIGYGILIYKL